MSSENAVFDADVSGFLRGLKQIQAQEKEAKRDIQALAIASAAGSKTATQGYIQQSKELARLSQQKQQYQTQLNGVIYGTKQLHAETRQLNTETARTSGSLGKTGAILNQVTFAADDFANTIGTMGAAGAVRSMGNNLSTLALQIHPLAGLFTVAGVAALSYALKTEDVAKSNDKAKESLDRYKESLKSIKLEIDRAKMSGEEFAKFQDSLPARTEVNALRLEERKASAVVGEKEKEFKEYLNRHGDQIRVNKQTGEIERVLVGRGATYQREAEAIRVQVNEARSKVNEIRGRIYTVKDAEAKRVRELGKGEARENNQARIREAVRGVIDRADAELQAEQQGPRFGIMQRRITGATQSVQRENDKLEDMRRAASMDGKTSDAEELAIRVQQETLEVQKRILEALQRQDKQPEIQRGIDASNLDRNANV